MFDGKSTVELYQDTYLWDCSNVRQFLEGTGIVEPEFDAALLQVYLGVLKEYSRMEQHQPGA
ncbi:hypothetical protein [Pseudomonas agarici]|nr:hypothetical protein [Pseudomonas agarici]